MEPPQLHPLLPIYPLSTWWVMAFPQFQRNWQIEFVQVNSLILLSFLQQKEKLDPYNPQKGVFSLSVPMTYFISSQCSVAMTTAIQVCTELGIPIESEKNEEPATTLSILGIEFDTEAMILRLPNTKLTLLRQQVQTWRGRKCCSKREFLSLIGSLQHAASVVKPGWAFVRRMIDLSSTRKHPEAKIHLSWEFHSDLEWWHHMAASWNGTSMLAPIKKDHPDITVPSDASGGWGRRAFWESNWFQLQWSGAASSTHITSQELIPIVLAAALWGHSWTGKTVRALSDNMAVHGSHYKLQTVSQH